MTTFIAVYRGETVAAARLVAVTANPEMVSYVATKLLETQNEPSDPVVDQLEGGRRKALRLIKREVDRKG